MNRLALRLTVAAVLFLGANAGTASAADRPSAQASSRSSYNPFAMRRAATAQPGTREYESFRRRQAIVRWCRDRVRPPHRRPPRSPRDPHDDNDHDDDDDDHGHDDDDDDDHGGGNGGGDNDHGGGGGNGGGNGDGDNDHGNGNRNGNHGNGNGNGNGNSNGGRRGRR